MPWESTADQLIHHDQEAMRTENGVVREEHVILADGRPAVMMSTKQPYHNRKGDIAGTIGISINISHLKMQPKLKDEHLFDTYKQWREEDNKLTHRELECIQWLIKGKSASEIALILGVTKRTIETHIENIKSKVNCYKQFQLGYILAKYGSALLA